MASNQQFSFEELCEHYKSGSLEETTDLLQCEWDVTLMDGLDENED